MEQRERKRKHQKERKRRCQACPGLERSDPVPGRFGFPCNASSTDMRSKDRFRLGETEPAGYGPLRGKPGQVWHLLQHTSNSTTQLYQVN